MSVRVLTGDCRDVLRTLAEQQFHTVVTSPPYFGLRDYGTAKWEGGDPHCPHIERTHDVIARASTLGPKRDGLKPDNAAFKSLERQFKIECGKCGARRIDSQLGLEPTPDEFVAALVAVFREVRRVLRDDGTVWLNLGTSYMTQPGKGDNVPQTKWKKNTYPAAAPHRVKQPDSDGKRASPSRQTQHDPAYGNDGTGPRGCSAPDCAYRGRGDEPLDGSQSHRDRTARTDRVLAEADAQPGTTGHDSEHRDCVEASPAASPPAAQASNVRASSERVPVAPDREDGPSASQSSPQTCADDEPQSAHMSACTCDTDSTSAPSSLNTSGKSSSGLACDCGSCGICWASLAIPLLRLKPKDEINIPHFVAMALQADGWFLRQTIIWSKPNPMPESVRDRCTKAHEYLFLLSKGPRYYFDQEAIAEPLQPSSVARLGQPTIDMQAGSNRVPGKTNGAMKAVAPRFGGAKYGDFEAEEHRTKSGNEWANETGRRNRRSVWTITTQPYSEAHFATFPPALVEPCIKAGCPVGGNVLDPFGGAGTTGLVADRLQRNATLIELNPAYAEMARGRLSKDGGMFAEVAAE